MNQQLVNVDKQLRFRKIRMTGSRKNDNRIMSISFLVLTKSPRFTSSEFLDPKYKIIQNKHQCQLAGDKLQNSVTCQNTSIVMYNQP